MKQKFGAQPAWTTTYYILKMQCNESNNKQHEKQQIFSWKMQCSKNRNTQLGQQQILFLKMQCNESNNKFISEQQQSFSKTLTKNGRRIKHGQNEGF